MPHYREEVFNLTLAQLLRGQGAAKAEAEKRYRDDMPDVLTTYSGSEPPDIDRARVGSA